jgi:hypothetical protein
MGTSGGQGTVCFHNRPEGNAVVLAEKIKVAIELESPVFKGWTVGEIWNGWECPYFEKEEADKVVKASSGKWSKDGETCHFDLNDEDYVVEKETIQTVEGPKVVWAIGNMYWIWSKIESQVEEIAFKFNENLKDSLTKAQYRMVLKLNEKEKDKSICHSHDYCDANMVMLSAVCEVTGRPEDPTADGIIELMNQSWEKWREMFCQ